MTDTFKETGWATQTPDVYGGPKCDRVVPAWTGFFLGDKDEDIGPTLTLKATQFPPGTKITIAEPTCPQCGSLREIGYKGKNRQTMFFKPECTGWIDHNPCDFRWDDWVLEKFS